MSYFKRRIKDSWQITKEMFSGVTWINAIVVVPGLLFMLFFVWFWMLFEDYEEIDKAKETVDHLFKSDTTGSSTSSIKGWLLNTRRI